MPCRWRGRGWGSRPTERWLDEELAASKPFVPSLHVARLRGPIEWAGWVCAGLLKEIVGAFD
jgi:hypothetical protein